MNQSIKSTFYFKPAFFYISCCRWSWCDSMFRGCQQCCVWAGCYVLHWVILSHVKNKLDSFLVMLWQRSITLPLRWCLQGNESLIFSHWQSHNSCCGVTMNVLLSYNTLFFRLSNAMPIIINCLMHPCKVQVFLQDSCSKYCMMLKPHAKNQ